MSAKRALIVDDSKSARAFLARILQGYKLEVDSAESAEQAIEYLASNHPDVIFMDHMMPGMDGFQAVQSIKNNPRTAMIPILMYTSQEGELYLGQARALGAVGVLPKQIKTADVSKVLYQLKLAPDRRSRSQSTFSAANDTAVLAALPESQSAPPEDFATSTQTNLTAPEANDLRHSVETAMRGQLHELRHHIMVNLDRHAEQMLGDMRAVMQDMLPAPEPSVPPPRRYTARGAWLLGALASLVAAGLAFMWWRETQLNQQMAAQLIEAQQKTQAATVAATRAMAAMRSNSTTAGDLTASGTGDDPALPRHDEATILPVPYGEVPLTGDRLEALHSLLNDLLARRFSGLVTVTSYAGRFCLKASAEGLGPASGDVLQSKCDVVGNPYDDNLSIGQRESLTLANLIGEIRRKSGNAIDVRLVQDNTLLVAYPSPAEKLLAAEWNKAAARNNRLEIKLQASSALLNP